MKTLLTHHQKSKPLWYSKVCETIKNSRLKRQCVWHLHTMKSTHLIKLIRWLQMNKSLKKGRRKRILHLDKCCQRGICLPPIVRAYDTRWRKCTLQIKSLLFMKIQAKVTFLHQIFQWELHSYRLSALHFWVTPCIIGLWPLVKLCKPDKFRSQKLKSMVIFKS